MSSDSEAIVEPTSPYAYLPQPGEFDSSYYIEQCMETRMSYMLKKYGIFKYIKWHVRLSKCQCERNTKPCVAVQRFSTQAIEYLKSNGIDAHYFWIQGNDNLWAGGESFAVFIMVDEWKCDQYNNTNLDTLLDIMNSALGECWRDAAIGSCMYSPDDAAEAARYSIDAPHRANYYWFISSELSGLVRATADGPGSNPRFGCSRF